MLYVICCIPGCSVSLCKLTNPGFIVVLVHVQFAVFKALFLDETFGINNTRPSFCYYVQSFVLYYQRLFVVPLT